MGPYIVDTGPLVAFLNRRDAHHEWAREQLARLRPPLLTCEAVLSEACFLLRSVHGGAEAVLRLVSRGVVAMPMRIVDEAEVIARLLARYRNVPMSLADACLVRLAERHAVGVVVTLDRHFQLYRKSGRQIIPTRMP